jgi:hypothetical protein
MEPRRPADQTSQFGELVILVVPCRVAEPCADRWSVRSADHAIACNAKIEAQWIVR